MASFCWAGVRKGAAHVLSLGLGAASAFGGAGADKIAFNIGQPAENGNHQAPGAGARVGPPFVEVRDHEIATGSITADATSDLAGSMTPPLPTPTVIANPHPAYEPHGTARMP
jgi:hypothetical protein